MLHLKDLPVLILGLGVSGLAMARWCTRHGALVTVADTREAPPQLQALHADCPQAQFVAGPFSASLVEGTAVRAVYCSPGLFPSVTAPVLDAARALGLSVGGELDLFALALTDLNKIRLALSTEAEQDAEVSTASSDDKVAPEVAPDSVNEPELNDAASRPVPATEPSLDVQAEAAEDEAVALVTVPPAVPVGYQPVVLAITGTNGKTTVTALTGRLIERAGKTVAVAGNIGPSLLDTLTTHLDADTLPQVWVLELSSFQLDSSTCFEPTAAIVLNLTQDHLDWHGSMAAYGKAKAKVFGTKGLMILNREDPAVMAMLPAPVRAKLQKPVIRAYMTVGGDMPQRPGDFGLEVLNGMTWLVRALEADETRRRRKDEPEELFFQRLMPADALRIRGRHNAVNALAALALASAAGCALGPSLYALREYQGEPHRVESVAIVNEVEYFDDSKGTNVGATVAALKGLGDSFAGQRRLHVILGGDGKGQDFSPLVDPVSRYVRSVILIGRDAPLIRQALAATGVDMVDADSLPQTVQWASTHAHAGDVVLLSPACASLDMFENYGHRARVFCDAVQALALDAGQSLEIIR